MIKFFNQILFLIIIFNVNLFAQNNETAKIFFIDGKIAEIKGNFPEAIENYITALNYSKSAGIYYTLSNAYYNYRKYGDALISIHNALKIDPNNIKFLEQKAKILFTQNKLTEAADIYLKILELDSNNVFSLFALSRIYTELKQSSKAIIYYEKIIDELGFDLEILQKMYDIYYNFKDYSNCARITEYALKLDPYNSLFLQQLGGLYSKLNKDEDAKKIFENLYKLNPENKYIQTELVKLYFKGNETQKGFENYAKTIGKEKLSIDEKLQVGELYFNIISQDKSFIKPAENIFKYLNQKYPELWQPYYYLAEIDMINNNNLNAISKLDNAVIFADTLSEALLFIGYSYFKLGSYDKAKTTLEKGMYLNQNDFRLLYTYGIILQREGDLINAVKYYEDALKLSGNDVNILSSLGSAYYNLKRYEESDAAFELALQIEPENILILNNYAYYLSERGEKLDKALSMAKIAVEKNPDNPSYLDTIGWIYYKMKKYELALKFISYAYEKNNNNAVIAEHLGDVYFSLKNLENAKYYWNIALNLNPNNLPLKEKIEKYFIN